jgi:hypothetical protein
MKRSTIVGLVSAGGWLTALVAILKCILGSTTP